jgi:hypothetical protein
MGYLVIAGLLCALAVGWFVITRAATPRELKEVEPARPAPEPARPRAPKLPAPEWVTRMTSGELAELCLRLLARMGYSMLSQEVDGDLAQVSAIDIAPTRGHRVLMRAYPNAAGQLGPEYLQHAVDVARAEGVNKVILVAVGGFTHEAEQLADESPLEILDGLQLAELAQVRMPELVAEEFRPPRPTSPPNGDHHLPA